MSLLRSSEPVKLDFSKGFTFFSSIKVRPQKHNGRKVIFQISQVEPIFKFTLGLDNKDDLTLWLEDAKGNFLYSLSIAKEKFFNRLVPVHFLVIPGNNTGESPKLELGVNEDFEQIDIEYDLRSEEDVVYSIGGNLNGKETAAFDMAAMSIYNIALSRSQIKQISKRLTREMGGGNG